MSDPYAPLLHVAVPSKEPGITVFVRATAGPSPGPPRPRAVLYINTVVTDRDSDGSCRDRVAPCPDPNRSTALVVGSPVPTRQLQDCPESESDSRNRSPQARQGWSTSTTSGSPISTCPAGRAAPGRRSRRPRSGAGGDEPSRAPPRRPSRRGSDRFALDPEAVPEMAVDRSVGDAPVLGAFDIDARVGEPAPGARTDHWRSRQSDCVRL